ncbi:putative phosphatase regulatory subunit-domain-containing protein [Infundibulicybe gibba]|nr:putative phosphatase regulatory subunit-domain-containing protein [Infundibulicybe gibba]
MIAVRSKRVRGIRLPAVCPPEQSTPVPPLPPAKCDGPKSHRPQISITLADTPGRGTTDDLPSDSTPRPIAPRHLIYSPGVPLRATTAALKARYSESSASPGFHANEAAIKSAPLETPEHPKMIRKKSGQLVKSSLKSSKRAPRGSLSIVTLAALSKSEPSTPTHKAVHFDSQLEHVKLFLAEQKPLAVSRDGSPTDDTSGTDTDFPSFIFGDSSQNNKGRLDMRIANMPRKINLNADVALEAFTLSSDLANIVGRVRVRNIAFHKWIAVRFTFDSWQTTSEVAAKYFESIDRDFDRFTFNIRLNDLLPRIEGKMMYLAVRYSVSEREMWDNNGGQNYLATFTKVKAGPKLGHLSPKSDDEDNLEVSGMENLRSKLERVAQGRDATTSSQAVRAGVAEKEREFVLKTNASLASRYDFGDRKKSWAVDTSPPVRHTRNHSYPAPSMLGPSSVVWPEKTPRVARNIIAPPRSKATLGPPRDTGEDCHSAPPQPSDTRESHHTPQDEAIRNHQRGYFDLDVLQGSGVRKTPPGTPHSRSFDDMTPLSTRFYSFPSLDKVLSPTPQRAHAHVGSPVTLTPIATIDAIRCLFSSSGSSRSASPSPHATPMHITVNFSINFAFTLAPTLDQARRLGPFTAPSQNRTLRVPRWHITQSPQLFSTHFDHTAQVPAHPERLFYAESPQAEYSIRPTTSH